MIPVDIYQQISKTSIVEIKSLTFNINNSILITFKFRDIIFSKTFLNLN